MCVWHWTVQDYCSSFFLEEQSFVVSLCNISLWSWGAEGLWTGFISSKCRCVLDICTHGNELLGYTKERKIAQP